MNIKIDRRRFLKGAISMGVATAAATCALTPAFASNDTIKRKKAPKMKFSSLGGRSAAIYKKGQFKSFGNGLV